MKQAEKKTKPHLKTQIRNVLLSIAVDPSIDAQYRLEALRRLDGLRNERRPRKSK